jgi:DNA-binding response OmpR family regulator
MKTLKILLAEGDLNLGPILKVHLEKSGFQTILVTDGQKAIETYSAKEVDFIILDASLSIMDGYMTAETIKNMDSKIPIIFLAGRSQTLQNKLRAFEIGADDFMYKPINLDELVYRILAIAKRVFGEKSKENIFYIGDYYVFDYSKRILSFKGNNDYVAEQIKLTGKESELLKIFLLKANQTITRQVILQRVWKNNTYFSARSMDVYITRLRKLLQYDPNVKLANIHGVGFKLMFTTQNTK